MNAEEEEESRSKTVHVVQVNVCDTICTFNLGSPNLESFELCGTGHGTRKETMYCVDKVVLFLLLLLLTRQFCFCPF